MKAGGGGEERHSSAWLALALVVIAWGFNFVCVKIAFRDWSAPALMLARYLLQLLFFAGVLAAGRLSFRAPKKLWPRILFAGFLGNGVYMVLFMEAMHRMGSAQGAVTMSTSPLFIALLSALNGSDKLSRSWAVGTALAFGGVVLTNFEGLMAPGGQSSWLGFGLMLSAAIVWAFAVMVIRPVISELGSIRGMALSMPGAMAALLPYGIGSLLQTPLSSLPTQAWLSMSYLVIVSGSIAFILYFFAIEKLGPARATVTQYLIPPTAAVFAWLTLGSHLTLYQIAGLCLALAGVFMAQQGKKAPTQGTIEV